MKHFVKIDFNLENVETKRGVVLSPTVQAVEFWCMILVEFPKNAMFQDAFYWSTISTGTRTSQIT